MIFALCSLSRGIRYPRYTWILRIRRCPLAAGELPNLQALCFDKHTTSAGDAWVPLNRQKEKRETMNTPIPDVEILPPEAPSATTVADPPPSDSRCCIAITMAPNAVSAGRNLSQVFAPAISA